MSQRNFRLTLGIITMFVTTLAVASLNLYTLSQYRDEYDLTTSALVAFIANILGIFILISLLFYVYHQTVDFYSDYTPFKKAQKDKEVEQKINALTSQLANLNRQTNDSSRENELDRQLERASKLVDELVKAQKSNQQKQTTQQGQQKQGAGNQQKAQQGGDQKKNP